jgi:hypothetical protein
MRLYSRTGATRLDDSEYGTFEPDAQGGFDFPDEVSDRLHPFHLGGKPMWETDVERQNRLMNEELERRKDPTTLLSAVEQLVKAAQAVSQVPAPAPAPAPAPVLEPKPVAKKTTAAKKTAPAAD